MKHRLAILVPALALAAAACGSSDESSVAIDGAWARASASGQSNGAVYFDLTVDADDRLVSASVDSSVAAEAQVHEVVMVEGEMDDMDDMDEMSGDMEDMDEMSGDMDDMDDMEGMEGMEGMDGQMRMQELPDGLALTADETVTFEPGGYHVMLLDLADPLEDGEEIDVTLEFAEAGEQSITVQVRESAP